MAGLGTSVSTAVLPRRKATRILLALFSIGLLFLAATTPLAAALAAVQQDVLGQVTFIETATIDGESHGVVLSVERGSHTPERSIPSFSEIILAPHGDPATWKRIGINGSAPLLATGDVDGDGHDDVVIGFASGGGSCAAALVGYSPCGAIIAFDGPALRNREPLQIARIMITSWPGSCGPSAYHPQSLSVRDLDGDGKAELAFGHLGFYPGTCGVVHVFNGRDLSGQVLMDDACARFDGEIMKQGTTPDQFGVQTDLYQEDGKAFIAIGAPSHSPPGKNGAGKVSVFELPAACVSGGPLVSTSVHDYVGNQGGALAGSDIMYLDGTLWISSSDRVEGIDATDFSSMAVHHPAGEIPLGRPGDRSGDGKPDLFLGPTVLTPDGGLVLHLGPFAKTTFRGGFIGDDEILSSDDYGLRLWSLKDVWNPSLLLASNMQIARVGNVVNVSVVEMVSVVPTPDPISFVTLGGKVVGRGPSWVLVEAVAPGEIVVQASILKTRSVVRVPVLPVEEEKQMYASVVGPDIVEQGQPLVVRAFVPPSSQLAWAAPGGTPSSGTGTQFETTYSEIGAKTVTLHVEMPDGTTRDLQHAAVVFANNVDLPPLRIAAPSKVPQGDIVQASVLDPVDGRVYDWVIEGRQVGVTSASGSAIEFPVSGWSLVNLTVTEKDGDVPVRMSHAQFQVENVRPEIVSVETWTEGSLKAKITTRDQGGDPVFTVWKVDGKEVGRGPGINLDLPPGPIELEVTITDVGGMAARDVRHLNITSEWRVVPKSDPTSTLPPDATIDSYAWKTDRLKAQSEAETKGGLVPGIGSPGLLGLLALAAFVWRADSRRRR